MRRVCMVVLVVTVLCHVPPLTTVQPHFTNEWAAHISGDLDSVRRIVKRHGFDLVQEIPNLDNYYLLTHNDVPTRSRRSADHHTSRLIDEDQTETGDAKRQAQGLVVHMDLQVLGAWQKGYSGLNVVVTVIDDGLEHNNTDLQLNYDPHASTDLNDNDPDPMPRLDPTNENKHGTRCAGEIAMAANNGKCGVGIAFNSKIGGIRMLDGRVTDRLEGQALSFNHTYIDIYSASWGPNDDGVTVEGPGVVASKALEAGIKYGRGGKGVIYVWASGNGGRMEDSCSCDGYASSIYTLSVSSASQHGMAPWYAERCASTLTTTFSSGAMGEPKVVSTDLRDTCTKDHTGTSASAPLAAGILALVLEANPSLTWRDVQHLVVLTSKPGPLMTEAGWYRNGAGFCANLAFGFGLMDALDLVTTANPDNWVNVPEKSICEATPVQSSLPQDLRNGQKVEVSIQTDGCQGQQNEVNYLEHAQFIFTMSYSRRGAVKVTVISPSGTETTLMPRRRYDRSNDGFQAWPLMSVHTWGEDPAGVWTFRVQDDDNPTVPQHGTLTSVTMVLHGTKEAPQYRKDMSSRCGLPATSHSSATSPPVRQKANDPHSLLSLLQKQLQKAKTKNKRLGDLEQPYYLYV